MRRKVLWTTFWLTTALWLGNAWGCAQHQARQVVSLSQPPVIDIPAVAEYQPAAPTVPLPGAVPPPAPTAPPGPAMAQAGAMAAADLPRRESWPPLFIGPATGTAEHWPVYFEDLQWRSPKRPINVLLIDERLDAALEGRTAQNYSAGNAVDAVVQPLKFALDLGLSPLEMVLVPPWTIATSP